MIRTSKSIKIAVEAFHAALHTISETQDSNSIKFKVEGSASRFYQEIYLINVFLIIKCILITTITISVFNGVIQLCIMHLPNAFRSFLKLSTNTHIAAHKCKRFIKVKGALKSYLTDLITVGIIVIFIT